MLVQRVLDRLDCTIYTGAVPARRGKDYFFDTRGRSRGHT
jgi:hypothetical protein